MSTQAEGLELGLVTCPATACWPNNYSPKTFPELVNGSRFRGWSATVGRARGLLLVVKRNPMTNKQSPLLGLADQHGDNLQRQVICEPGGKGTTYNSGPIIGLTPKRWPTKRSIHLGGKRFQQEKSGGISGGINTTPRNNIPAFSIG